MMELMRMLHDTCEERLRHVEVVHISHSGDAIFVRFRYRDRPELPAATVTLARAAWSTDESLFDELCDAIERAVALSPCPQCGSARRLIGAESFRDSSSRHRRSQSALHCVACGTNEPIARPDDVSEAPCPICMKPAVTAWMDGQEVAWWGCGQCGEFFAADGFTASLASHRTRGFDGGRKLRGLQRATRGSLAPLLLTAANWEETARPYLSR